MNRWATSEEEESTERIDWLNAFIEIRNDRSRKRRGLSNKQPSQYEFRDNRKEKKLLDTHLI